MDENLYLMSYYIWQLFHTYEYCVMVIDITIDLSIGK